jgi:hypothetical protein
MRSPFGWRVSSAERYKLNVRQITLLTHRHSNGCDCDRAIGDAELV